MAVAAVAAGCYTAQGRGPTESVGATSRIVETKRPPATLIAVDRSTCLTSVRRYRDTRIGEAVWCHWRGGEPILEPRYPGAR
jgi:hypothetical protein